MLLMSLGVAAVGLAYLFPYDSVTADRAKTARQAESVELRVWTVFTVSWTTGLTLITLGVIIITSTVIITNYWTCALTHSDAVALHGRTLKHYGTSDSVPTQHHQQEGGHQ